LATVGCVGARFGFSDELWNRGLFVSVFVSGKPARVRALLILFR